MISRTFVLTSLASLLEERGQLASLVAGAGLPEDAPGLHLWQHALTAWIVLARLC